MVLSQAGRLPDISSAAVDVVVARDVEQAAIVHDLPGYASVIGGRVFHPNAGQLGALVG